MKAELGRLYGFRPLPTAMLYLLPVTFLRYKGGLTLNPSVYWSFLCFVIILNGGEYPAGNLPKSITGVNKKR